MHRGTTPLARLGKATTLMTDGRGNA